MRKITTILALCATSIAIGQTNYTINAQGTSWISNDITIEVGDSVTWINNNGGNHNLNGTTATFPSNPVSFGQPNVGQMWTYGFRFTVAGTYNYRCDPHQSMMTGVITVEDNAGLNEPTKASFSMNPNPTNGEVSISTDWKNYSVTIYDLTGAKVLSLEITNNNSLDLTNLKKGVYIVEIASGNEVMQERLVKN